MTINLAYRMNRLVAKINVLYIYVLRYIMIYNPMPNKQRLYLKIALIIIALFIGQFAALLHSAEHPFHEYTESCQLYFALEQSENGLISHCSVIQTPIIPFHQPIETNSATTTVLQTSYCIRAPPYSLVA